jgi:hypothetical protein
VDEAPLIPTPPMPTDVPAKTDNGTTGTTQQSE